MVSFGKLYLFGMVFTQLSFWLIAKISMDGEVLDGEKFKVRFPFIFGLKHIHYAFLLLLMDGLFGLIIAQVLDLAQIGGL